MIEERIEKINMKKIAVFFATGYEEIEALTVVDLCRRAGIDTQMVSVTSEDAVTGAHDISVKMDKQFAEVNFEELDMVVLPGGMPGTKNLEAHNELMEQVDAFDRAGRYIAAICAAPSIFGHRGILEGKKACCYPGFEKELHGADVVFESVIRDGHVITSRGMGCAIDFALEIISVLCGTDVADEKAKAIIYK